MKTPVQIRTFLDNATHGLVRLMNAAEEQSDLTKSRILVHGKLEEPEEGCEDYFVRIGEDPSGHGTNGISFVISEVADVFRQPSGISTIVLKG